MLVTQINSFLNSIYNDSNKLSTVLIYGKWGCGKTFAINEFVSSENKPNVIYVSLFGIGDKNDIFAILSEYLDSSFLARVNGDYFVKPAVEKASYKYALVVFDDLERKGEGLTYTAIYGIVDALRKQGIKVVCVINEENLGSNLNEFNEFKEKTFDAILSVEADINAAMNIVGDKHLVGDNLIKVVKENLRTLERAKLFYDSIVFQINQRKLTTFFDVIGVTKNIYFEYIALASRCLFSSNNKKPTFKNGDYESFSYDRRVDAYGEYIANELFLVKQQETDVSVYKIEELIALMISGDFDKYFSNYYYKESPELLKASILYEEPFYLSDSEKEEYKAAFLNNCNKFDFSNQLYEKTLLRFLNTFILSINETEKEAIADRIVETVSREESRDIFGSIRLSENVSVSNDFMKMLEDKYLIHKRTTNEKMFKSLLQTKNYSELTNFIYNNRYISESEKEIILELFEKNDYVLPDLSEKVDHSSWTYCHEIAKYVSGTKHEKSFIAVLGSQCKQNRSSISLREKCNALVHYNLGEKVDFFELCPIKKRRALK